jgi:hypothetical protein
MRQKIYFTVAMEFVKAMLAKMKGEMLAKIDANMKTM